MKINLCPDTLLLNSFIERSGASLKGMLAELLDNAFDQGARHIWVVFENDTLTITDDGRGVSDWSALLRLGRHAGTGRTVGRWGVGFKHAVIWLASTVDIETRHKNARAFTRIDWPSLMDQGNIWEWEAGDFKPDPGPSFTRIALSGIRKRRLRNLEQVADELAYRYTPGLQEGLEISINGRRLQPIPPPEFEGKPIVFEGSWDDKAYRLTAGIKVARSEPERCGYDVAYLHRLIRQHDLTGCSGFSGQRFYGYLELLNTGDDDWILAEHKDDFDGRDDFYEEELLPQIMPILEAAAAAKETLAFRDLQELVAARFGFVTRGRERRKPGDKEGSREPKETPRKRRKATEVHPDPSSPVTSKLNNCSINITFDCQQPDKVGVVQTGGSQIVVSLNPSFDIVSRKDPDAITALVCALLALDDEWNERNRNRFLPYKELDALHPRISDLSELLARVMQEQPVAVS